MDPAAEAHNEAISAETSADGTSSDIGRSSEEKPAKIPGFEIIDLLGTGGMGRVFKARQTAIGRIVALKVLHRHQLSDRVQLQRFQQEAHVSTLLEHPNIAKVFSFGVTDEGWFYLVMEYCQGNTLKQLIEDGQLTSWKEIVDLYSQICSALEHAHAKGVVHRDLKPANVFIQTDESNRKIVKVLDFGIAKLLQPDGTTDQKLTRTGTFLGSPHYMSPEQCIGGTIDGRSDIYSLGCMLFETLTGSPPFEGDTVMEVASHQLSDQAKSLFDTKAKYRGKELDALIKKAMAKSANDRFSDAAQFHNALIAVSPVAGKAGVLTRFIDINFLSKVAAAAGISIALVGAGFWSYSFFNSYSVVRFDVAEAELDVGHLDQAQNQLFAVSASNLSPEQRKVWADDLLEIGRIQQSRQNPAAMIRICEEIILACNPSIHPNYSNCSREYLEAILLKEQYQSSSRELELLREQRHSTEDAAFLEGRQSQGDGYEASKYHNFDVAWQKYDEAITKFKEAKACAWAVDTTEWLANTAVARARPDLLEQAYLKADEIGRSDPPDKRATAYSLIHSGQHAMAHQKLELATKLFNCAEHLADPKFMRSFERAELYSLLATIASTLDKSEAMEAYAGKAARLYDVKIKDPEKAADCLALEASAQYRAAAFGRPGLPNSERPAKGNEAAANFKAAANTYKALAENKGGGLTDDANGALRNKWVEATLQRIQAEMFCGRKQEAAEIARASLQVLSANLQRYRQILNWEKSTTHDFRPNTVISYVAAARQQLQLLRVLDTTEEGRADLLFAVELIPYYRSEHFVQCLVYNDLSDATTDVPKKLDCIKKSLDEAIAYANGDLSNAAVRAIHAKYVNALYLYRRMPECRQHAELFMSHLADGKLNWDEFQERAVPVTLADVYTEQREYAKALALYQKYLRHDGTVLPAPLGAIALKFEELCQKMVASAPGRK